MKSTLKRNTWILMLTLTPLLWGIGIWVLATKPSKAVHSPHSTDSLVIVDRGDYGDIRFYHDDIAPDTLNYIYNHSQITNTTLKR